MTAEDGTFGSPGHRQVTTAGDREVMTAAPSHRGDLFSPDCPTRQLLDRIGGKWVSMAVKVLGDDYPGEIRFAELKRRMPGISQKMLAQTLRQLERDSLVARRVEPTTPPRVHYRLTALGYSLTEPIAALRDWAELHMAQIDAATELWDSRARADRLSGPAQEPTTIRA